MYWLLKLLLDHPMKSLPPISRGAGPAALRRHRREVPGAPADVQAHLSLSLYIYIYIYIYYTHIHIDR